MRCTACARKLVPCSWHRHHRWWIQYFFPEERCFGRCFGSCFGPITTPCQWDPHQRWWSFMRCLSFSCRPTCPNWSGSWPSPPFRPISAPPPSFLLLPGCAWCSQSTRPLALAEPFSLALQAFLQPEEEVPLLHPLLSSSMAQAAAAVLQVFWCGQLRVAYLALFPSSPPSSKVLGLPCPKLYWHRGLKIFHWWRICTPAGEAH